MSNDNSKRHHGPRAALFFSIALVLMFASSAMADVGEPLNTEFTYDAFNQRLFVTFDTADHNCKDGSGGPDDTYKKIPAFSVFLDTTDDSTQNPLDPTTLGAALADLNFSLSTTNVAGINAYDVNGTSQFLQELHDPAGNDCNNGAGPGVCYDMFRVRQCSEGNPLAEFATTLVYDNVATLPFGACVVYL